MLAGATLLRDSITAGDSRRFGEGSQPALRGPGEVRRGSPPDRSAVRRGDPDAADPGQVGDAARVSCARRQRAVAGTGPPNSSSHAAKASAGIRRAQRAAGVRLCPDRFDHVAGVHPGAVAEGETLPQAAGPGPGAGRGRAPAREGRAGLAGLPRRTRTGRASPGRTGGAPRVTGPRRTRRRRARSRPSRRAGAGPRARTRPTGSTPSGDTATSVTSAR